MIKILLLVLICAPLFSKDYYTNAVISNTKALEITKYYGNTYRATGDETGLGFAINAFDDVADHSINNEVITISNSASYATSGYTGFGYGGCWVGELSPAGQKRAIIIQDPGSTNAGIDRTQSMTLSIWIKFFEEATNPGTVWSKDNAYTGARSWNLLHSTGKVRIYMWDAAGEIHSIITDDVVPYNKDEWKMLTVTFDPLTKVAIYLDGGLTKEITSGVWNSLKGTNTKALIGGSWTSGTETVYGSGQGFAFKFAEIYNYCMTDAQVLDLYNLQKPTPPPTLSGGITLEITGDYPATHIQYSGDVVYTNDVYGTTYMPDEPKISRDIGDWVTVKTPPKYYGSDTITIFGNVRLQGGTNVYTVDD